MNTEKSFQQALEWLDKYMEKQLLTFSLYHTHTHTHTFICGGLRPKDEN